MGYTHGRRWTEQEVLDGIMQVVNALGLKHFPTQKQICDFYGDSSLKVRISKGGGSRYYADLLHLDFVDCESEFGNFYEELAIDDILSNTGFLSLHTNIRYPYDLLTNGNIKVDVKASKKNTRKKSPYAYYSFNLEKREPTCDIFIFYCIDEDMEVEKRLIIPSCILSGKTQVGIGCLSKWDAYIDKWCYFEQYDKFYKEVLHTAINFPRRRSS